MMKYLTYFFVAITSAFLVILLSLASCSPTPQATTAPSVLNNPSISQPQPPASQPQTQLQASSQPAKAIVKIQNFKFEPANVTIAVGETVQFINEDEDPHTATATDGAFNSKGLDTNQTWNYTATQPGTFPYICSIHPFMKGTLIVTPQKS